jgi:hypothetical protein
MRRIAFLVYFITVLVYLILVVLASELLGIVDDDEKK